MAAIQQVMITFFDTGTPPAPAFSPADIFTGSDDGVWLDYSDLSRMWTDNGKTTPVASDGNKLRRIIEKGPSAYEFDAPSDVLRPTYKTDGTLHWLLTSQFVLRHATISAFASKGAFTKIIGIEYISTGGNSGSDDVPAGAATIQNNSYFASYSTGGVSGRKNAGTLTTGVKYVIALVFDGSQAATHAARLKVYYNDVLQTWDTTAGTINTTTSATAGAYIGAVNASASASLNGKMFQWFGINKALGDADREAVQTYIGAKMGIVV